MLITFKKILLWCLGAVAIVVPTSLLTMHYAGAGKLSLFQSPQPKSSSVSAEPAFDSLQAVQACEKKSAAKFDGELLGSSVDWRSTRFQPSRNVFIVILKGNVGTYDDFEEANIYCYVNPKSEKVTYFKAYDSENKPMLSNGISMDAMLESFGRD